MGKRRFAGFLRGHNQSTSASRFANVSLDGRVQGWDLGVRVYAHQTDFGTGDEFEIFITGGTNETMREKYIGVVRNGEFVGKYA